MPKPSQHTSIAASLRDDILRGQYREGERLPSERDLAERFGVHRSTIREAFKRLEQLGVADIQRGGARVNPIEQASLDVVEHLLALEDPPSPELVDQTLETMSGLLAMSARLATERATDDQRDALLDKIREIARDTEQPSRRASRFSELGDLFVEASGNLVFRLVRNGLQSRYSEYVMPDHRTDRVPAAAVTPLLESLAIAIETGDAEAASEAILALTSELRLHMRETLEAERSAPTAAGGIGR